MGRITSEAVANNSFQELEEINSVIREAVEIRRNHLDVGSKSQLQNLWNGSSNSKAEFSDNRAKQYQDISFSGFRNVVAVVLKDLENWEDEVLCDEMRILSFFHVSSDKTQNILSDASHLFHDGPLQDVLSIVFHFVRNQLGIEDVEFEHVEINFG